VLARLLLDDHRLALVVLGQVLTRNQTDHVTVRVRARHTHRSTLRVQGDRPPVSSVPILEERHPISRCGESLIARISVDVLVLENLQQWGRVGSDTIGE
jgi:hypothetical protein